MYWVYSFAVGKIMAGISWKRLSGRFCLRICSILPSLGVPTCPTEQGTGPAFPHPFSPAAGLRQVSPVFRPIHHLQLLPGFPSTAPKTCIFLRSRAKGGTCCGSRKLVFVPIVKIHLSPEYHSSICAVPVGTQEPTKEVGTESDE